MPRKARIPVALPSEIVERIDKVIELQKYGFTSRNAFVLEAVKAHLEKFGAYP